jgi:hypothetical protein
MGAPTRRGWRGLGRRMRLARVVQGLAFAGLAVSLVSSSASAFEFFDGRLQLHGFYEAQFRAISRDFSEDWDLTQWYNVLNLELEADIASDGWGPFDLVSAYSRIEVRYDCVWTRACSLFDSANAYGSRSRRGRLPERLVDGRRSGFTATALNSISGSPDTREYHDVPWFAFNCPPDDEGCLEAQQLTVLDGPPGSRKPIRLWQQSAYVRQFGTSPGVDQVFDPIGAALCPLPFNDSIFCGRETVDDVLAPIAFTDDPGANVMRSLKDCFYGDQKTGGPTAGQGNRALLLSIDGCRIQEIGVLRGIPNPFNSNDINPWLGRALDGTPLGGSNALPFRPAPGMPYTAPGDPTRAQGIYYPPRELSNAIRDGEFEKLPHFSESDLSWNRGASQDQTKELKELYFDLEFFDSRLWVRAGKQNIVWGKTELFRTTDQFNPQDLALASLPTLEESRIGLWALRGVWSFYDVGPLQDVRLEMAMNYDEFQPSDLGVCGEPYTIDLVCGGSFGLQIHGVLGLGLAGVVVPPDAWDSGSGIEVGGRLEWRYDRFSFAISDFYGYADFPTVDQITGYSRNVDPLSGAPRRSRSQEPCPNNDATLGPVEPGCLAVIDTDGDGFANAAADTDGDGLPDTLTDHHANQQIFAWICGMTIGVTTLDPASCGNSIFNSSRNFILEIPAEDPVNDLTLASLTSGILAANSQALLLAASPRFVGAPLPAVFLNRDVGDTRPGSGGFNGGALDFDTLNKVSTAQQQALLGCGELYASDCDWQGFDLLNAEASALFQTFSGFEGTASAATAYNWDLTDPTVPQPGTVGFVGRGGPVCTRYVPGEGVVVLPGCRGVDYVTGVVDGGNPATFDYVPSIDGCTGPDNPAIVGDEECALSNPNDPVPGARDLIVPFFDPDYPGTINGQRFYQGPFDLDGDGIAESDLPAFDPRFASEFAAISWNLQMMLVGFSSTALVDANPDQAFKPDDPFRTDGCSFAAPHFCIAVGGFLDFTRVQRATLRAAGNAEYGRRDFVWQMGTPLKARFEKRNVLGFSMDWAEDVTKSNWSVETTWIEGEPVFDSDSLEGTTDIDTYNFTVSVDRPTFINFLNSNRTFFMNSQWFVQYVDGYTRNMPGSGPWNVLGTLTATTGYFQDRLLPAITFVYDVRSSSGAVLPSVAYRFTENFSATFGVAAFYGRQEYRTTAVTQIGASNRVHRHKDEDAALRGLAAIRDRDEVFLRVKYTF